MQEWLWDQKTHAGGPLVNDDHDFDVAERDIQFTSSMLSLQNSGSTYDLRASDRQLPQRRTLRIRARDADDKWRGLQYARMQRGGWNNIIRKTIDRERKAIEIESKRLSVAELKHAHFISAAQRIGRRIQQWRTACTAVIYGLRWKHAVQEQPR